MAIREWLRPPRQVLVIFLAVAALSTASLGWLTRRLLEQDAQLEAQRERVRLEQAADATVAGMQQSLAELRGLATRTSLDASRLPSGVAVVTIANGAFVVRPAGSIPFLPAVSQRVAAAPDIFTEAEQLEFQQRDRTQAASMYVRIARSRNPAVRAGALARLWRVRRNATDVDRALEAYASLEGLDETMVFNLPASLVAAAGRIGALAESSRTRELREASRSLATDLAEGRWPLQRSEYEAYAALAREHLQDVPAPTADALARAHALEWVWENRGRDASVSQRLISADGSPTLAVWQIGSGRSNIVLAGPSFLAELCSVVPGTRCAVSDLEGRTGVAGPGGFKILRAARMSRAYLRDYRA